MSQQWQCWHCGHQLKDVILPFSRRQLCDQCNADQHVCRMCKFFDVSTAGQCNEDRAEDISNKESANFCDYFSPNPKAYDSASNKRQETAQSKLDALFGDDSRSNKQSEDAEGSKTNPVMEKNANARKALDDLFGGTDSE